MAVDEDLELVKSGEHDLSGCVLEGANLARRDLRGRDFSKANLQRAVLDGCKLTGCDFTDAEVSFATFVGADLRGVRLPRAQVQTNYTRANLQGADFQRANLVSCVFDEADLRGADFRYAIIRDRSSFRGAISDESTLFDDASPMRDIARDLTFRFYGYSRGKLHRTDGEAVVTGVVDSPNAGSEASADISPNAAPESRASLPPNAAHAGATEERLYSHAREASALAAHLKNAIRDEIEALEERLPNDPEAIYFHEDYIEFLVNLERSLNRLVLTLDAAVAADSESARSASLSAAAATVEALAEETSTWVKNNNNNIVEYGAKLTLVGIGCSLFSLLGASGDLALTTAVGLLAFSSRNRTDEREQ